MALARVPAFASTFVITPAIAFEELLWLIGSPHFVQKAVSALNGNPQFVQNPITGVGDASL
ncbi:MAG: hypothetical protein RR234_03060 [Christensenella sp.]